MSLMTKIMIEKATTEFMDILKKFDKDRTIGSIKRKEIKSIFKEKLGNIKIEELMKKI